MSGGKNHLQITNCKKTIKIHECESDGTLLTFVRGPTTSDMEALSKQAQKQNTHRGSGQNRAKWKALIGLMYNSIEIFAFSLTLDTWILQTSIDKHSEHNTQRSP